MGLIKTESLSFSNQKDYFDVEVLSTGQVRFRLAAPSVATVDIFITQNNNQTQTIPLQRVSQEVFELVTDLASIGTQYQYLIDGKLTVPDPVSRFQPRGVHGPSQILDASSFQWTDSSWMGRPWQESIIYELHIGTFSESGTYAGVIEKLDDLISLGVTAIELMPIAEFPGNRNWGYDGVLLFAPSHNYGHPDELKRLINECHKKGLMVFLDVVYNHFGPEGNYLHAYADYFFTDKYKTPWGKAINFDSTNSDLVRNFFINNALYWLKEFHFDGLRLDAVHAINDSSKQHIITELCATIDSYKAAGQHIHIILENDSNKAHFLERDKNSKPIYATAQWNDDLHHIMHVIATEEKEGYYVDYAVPDDQRSVLNKLGRGLTEGFIYQGEASTAHQGEKRGEPSKHLPSIAFISFLQNHDQIGNRAFGERIEKIAIAQRLKVITAIFILNPEVPMLFMGEEWAASTPFYYFCNMGKDLDPLITKGRREEFKHFSAFNDPQKLAQIPDPCKIETFKASVLNWQERNELKHREWLNYYQSLIAIRKKYILPIISQLLPGKAHYKITASNVLIADWPLSNSTLRLLTNLSEQEADLDIKIAAGFKLFFETRENSYQKLCQGKIPSHSAIWLLE